MDDNACCHQWFSDMRLVHANKIVLVSDNLNTHEVATLHQAFVPDKAYCMVECFEFYDTPRLGGWLNIAVRPAEAISRPQNPRHA